MKKNLSLILVSVLMLLSLSVNIFAEESETYTFDPCEDGHHYDIVVDRSLKCDICGDLVEAGCDILGHVAGEKDICIYCGTELHSCANGQHIANQSDFCVKCEAYTLTSDNWNCDINGHLYDYWYTHACNICGKKTDVEILAMGGYYQEPGHVHADTNRDNYCDSCNFPMCYFLSEYPHDFGSDGKCKRCFMDSCKAGITEHKDTDHDYRCDKCASFYCRVGLINHIDVNSNGYCDRCGDLIAYIENGTSVDSCSVTGWKHEYEEISRTEPNCTDKGTVTYKCQKCQQEMTTYIERNGHRYPHTAVVEIMPTNSSAGLMYVQCPDCLEKITREIPSLKGSNSNILVYGLVILGAVSTVVFGFFKFGVGSKNLKNPLSNEGSTVSLEEIEKKISVNINNITVDTDLPQDNPVYLVLKKGIQSIKCKVNSVEGMINKELYKKLKGKTVVINIENQERFDSFVNEFVTEEEKVNKDSNIVLVLPNELADKNADELNEFIENKVIRNYLNYEVGDTENNEEIGLAIVSMIILPSYKPTAGSDSVTKVLKYMAKQCNLTEINTIVDLLDTYKLGSKVVSSKGAIKVTAATAKFLKSAAPFIKQAGFEVVGDYVAKGSKITVSLFSIVDSLSNDVGSFEVREIIEEIKNVDKLVS